MTEDDVKLGRFKTLNLLQFVTREIHTKKTRQHNVFILQVCHSKNGDINPLKIQKLVKGYVKKYSYAKRKTNQRTF